MCTKFQVNWTSTSSKTTLTKNFNLKWDRRMNEWTHRPENIMPLYYCRWGIKMSSNKTSEDSPRVDGVSGSIEKVKMASLNKKFHCSNSQCHAE